MPGRNRPFSGRDIYHRKNRIRSHRRNPSFEEDETKGLDQAAHGENGYSLN